LVAIRIGNREKIMTRLQKIWLFSLVLMFTVAMLATFGNLLLVHLNYLPFMDTITFQKKCPVPTVVPDQDQNHNGIQDSIDLVNGARQEVTRRTWYDTSYYQGGYPPEGRGDDADVIWRAFRAAGYNLKDMVDADIRTDPAAYSAFVKKPDPNIDFRKVGVLDVFFQRHATLLTKDVKPGDASNLVQWQPGDIVVFGLPADPDHIAIISNRRRKDGVPLVIHNVWPWATEGDYLLRWRSKIFQHFRYINY
jgi:uncharacterized protein YijF (DUF1287 family)